MEVLSTVHIYQDNVEEFMLPKLYGDAGWFFLQDTAPVHIVNTGFNDHTVTAEFARNLPWPIPGRKSFYITICM